MHTHVADVMTRDVVKVDEDTEYKEIVGRMHRWHVSAVPVLDGTGAVRGVVSESDLLFKQTDPDDRIHLSPARRAARRKAGGTVAAELMTAPAITITPTATVADAAGLMRRHKINQVVVVDGPGQRLTGILSRSDVLSVYRRPDADIERDVREEVLAGEFGMDPARFEIQVSGGHVTIGGTIDQRSRITELMRSIRYVDGVVSATCRLDYAADDTHVPYGTY